MDINDLHPHLKAIESVCLRSLHYLEEGHECYVFVLDKLRENNGRRIRQYKGKSAFRTYLIAVTHRLIIDFIRVRQGKSGVRPGFPATRSLVNHRRSLIDLEDATLAIADPYPGPEDLLCQVESESLKSKALAITRELTADLSPEDRLVLRMKFEDGLKVSTIARSLNLSQRTLYGRIRRLLKHLKSEILKKGLKIEDLHGALAE